MKLTYCTWSSTLALTLAIGASACGGTQAGTDTTQQDQELRNRNRRKPPAPKPEPAPCDILGERECLVRDDCQAEYVEWGYACASGADGVAEEDCEVPDPSNGREFTGCIKVDPCSKFTTEDACLAGGVACLALGCPEPLKCEPVYGVPPCPLGACWIDDAGVSHCPECDTTERFLFCQTPNPCRGLDERTCSATPACAPIYNWTRCDDSRERDPTLLGGSGGADAAHPLPCDPANSDVCIPCVPEHVFQGCDVVGPSGGPEDPRPLPARG